MFLTVDGTFWVQLVNFAIFFVILNLVFVRPVQRAIAERRAYIDSLTHDYDRAQAEASSLRAQADTIRAEARRESDHILAAGRNDGGNEAARIATEYASKVQAIVESAHATVASEVAAIKPQQDALAQELADGIVGKVLPEVRA
jgi:F0F1-type ATP synthase membrane subunit b/b'